MKPFRRACLYSLFFIAALFVCPDSFSQISNKTVIKGIVTDAKTGDPVPFVSVFLKGTTVGTLTDKEGKYSIETQVPVTNIGFSFIGYQTELRKIIQGKEQTINIRLALTLITLDEVIVSPARRNYKNKDNPAVELIKKVIDNKDANKKESYDFLEFKQYDKIQFALSNITEKFKKGNLFGKFRFIFET